VAESYDAITCPVYAVGGWADAYTNAIPRLLQGLTVPRKGLIGPWAHVYPHNGIPGPPIGFLQEALRWWDQWLSGRDTGILDEPMLRAWMPEPVEPARHAFHSPGRWIAEPRWPPSEGMGWLRLALSRGRLESAPPSPSSEEETIAIASPLDTGLASGSWCSFGAPEEMPLDQREDDAKSVVFDSEPLEERIEILGAPRLSLRLSSESASATLAARLEDVFPDGAASRVSYALLDLAHRDGHENPSPLVPGEPYRVRLPLNDCAYAFLPGHRIRLALSSSYWPIAWPPPGRSSLRLHPAESFLELPRRAPRPEDSDLRPFPPPESARNASTTELNRGKSGRTIVHDEATGETRYQFTSDFTEDGEPALTRIEATRMEHGHAAIESFSVTGNDPNSARAEVLHDARFQRGSWRVRVRTTTRLRSDERSFRIEAELEGFEGERRVFRRDYRGIVPRSGKLEP
jgi:predicted acyl esterase